MGGDETLQPQRSEEEAARKLAVGVPAGGRYRIDRFIASGGMGEVYAAHDLVLDTTVALKTLRSELEGSSAAVERLRREISLARNVTNPHVCRLHDVGDHEGRVFLTMELLEGQTLAQRIEAGALAIAEIERLAVQLVDGMAALHHAGIIHRDFKSANVIVAGERAVITDFGLARAIESDARLTVESSLVGTPAYMSPEQVEARPATKASDVYAFGVVLFEMLTGALPFQGDTPMTTAMARLDRPAPRPSSVRAGLPRRWDAIVSRCLERDPAKRPARIEDVLAVEAPSRRWFLAAGAGVLAAGALGAWKLRGCVATERVSGPVAVLPVAGHGSYRRDPWRMAITHDLYDELGTSDLELLSPYGGSLPMSVEMNDAIDELANDLDPMAKLAERGIVAAIRVFMTRSSDRIELTLLGHGTLAGWDHRLARPLDEVALLVSDAAAAIAEELGGRPPRKPRDTARLNGAIYEAWGVGLSSLLRRPTLEEEAAKRAGTGPHPFATLVELVEAEPWLARAGARLGEMLMMAFEQLENAKAVKKLARLRKMLETVLAVDPDNALALATRGHLAMIADWDWPTADADTKRAVELAPNHSRVRYHRAFLTQMLGRFEEQIAEHQRHRIRDPRGDLEIVHLMWYARRWPDVVRLVEPTIPATGKIHDRFEAILLAQSYAEMTRFEEGARLADRLRAEGLVKDDPYLATGLVPVYVAAGRIDDAKAVRAEIGEGTDLEALAIMDDALGDIEPALDKLEKVVAAHNIHAAFLRIERFTMQLRATPRFQKLIKTVFNDYR